MNNTIYSLQIKEINLVNTQVKKFINLDFFFHQQNACYIKTIPYK